MYAQVGLKMETPACRTSRESVGENTPTNILFLVTSTFVLNHIVIFSLTSFLILTLILVTLTYDLGDVDL